MKDGVAACGKRRLRPRAERSRQRLHADIVREQEAVESDVPAHDAGNALRRQGRWAFRIDGGEHHVRGHRVRRIRVDLEREEIGSREEIERFFHYRQLQVAVGAGAAMARNVLDHRRDASGNEAGARFAAELADQRRIAGKRSVADDAVGARDRYVEDRRAVDVDAEIAEFRRQKLSIEPNGLACSGKIALRQGAEYSRCRRRTPMGWCKPLDAPAFLIDQDWRIDSANRTAQLRRERPDLRGLDTVAGKQDKAERV